MTIEIGGNLLIAIIIVSITAGSIASVITTAWNNRKR